MHHHPIRFLATLFVLTAAGWRAEAATVLENDRYSVSVETAQGSFSVATKPDGKVVLADGKLAGPGGNSTAKVIGLPDKGLGQGQAVEITYANGQREVIGLYPGFPFVTFQTIFANGGREPVVLNHVPGVSARVELGKPLAGIKALGTGGLLEPARNPGSYAFLAVVDPQTRSGVVGGWLTHDRGSGVVFSPVQDGAVRIQAQIDYGRLRIKPSAEAAAETFAIGWFDDARFGLEAYADAIARIYAVKLPRQQAGFCTWYMEKHAGACDEVHLPEVSAVAAKELKPFGFDFIQIDDMWQDGVKGNGPKKNFTTHAAKGPYPSGMKAAADNISKAGLVPGIWFMPFAGNYLDPWFKDHQDWFAKDPQGKPYETAWGGTCLDMTNPAAQEYVRGIVSCISHDWGYRLFKMDGFWTGSATKQIYVNDGYREDGIGDAEFFNPDKTNIEALRDGVRLVRQAAGPEVFLLGCCVSQNMRSFGGSFGLLDAMRVGPDTGGNIGSPHGSRLWFLNGRVWWNDPDCVFVRKQMTLDRARLNAGWTAISGQLFYVSDWMPETPAERLDIVKRCLPAHGLPARPVDVFESPVARIWLLTDTRQAVRRDVVAFYNWENDRAEIAATPERIGLPPAREYVAFDFWANKFVAPFRGQLSASLPGNSSRILAVRPVSEHPQLLSTSRHVTQGIVDVTGETWDAGTSTLSGTSQVVASDPYELRIVVPAGENSWRATGIRLQAADEAAGVKAEFKQDGPRIRATVKSPASREVKWTVAFERGSAIAAVPAPVANLKARVEYRQIALTWDDNGADAYRITRSDGQVRTEPAAAFADQKFPREKPLTYQVEALNAEGQSAAPVSIEVTPLKELKPPPAPPLPSVYLDAKNTKIPQNGWGKPGFDKSVAGGPLKLDGKTYEKGLGLHAKALAVCAIPPGATHFVATAGIDDSQRHDARTSVFLQVYGDVKEMGEAPVLLAESPTLSAGTTFSWNFNIELNARYKELRLVVADADDGIAADHADWVNAGFVVPTAK